MSGEAGGNGIIYKAIKVKKKKKKKISHLILPMSKSLRPQPQRHLTLNQMHLPTSSFLLFRKSPGQHTCSDRLLLPKGADECRLSPRVRSGTPSKA